MGKAIFFGTPADGHVNPSLGLVRELARRGEEILYYSFPGYERRIAAAGAEYRATPVARPDVGAKRLSFLYRSIVEVTAEGLERCVRVVEDERPAYVIHDSLAPWGKFAAQLAGVPSVASVPSFVYRSRPFRLKDLL